MNRSSVPWLAGTVIAVILLTAILALIAWIKIAGLKKELVANLGLALGAQVDVSSLQIDFWQGEIHAAGISLINQRPQAPWEKGAISQATARFHLADLFSSSISLSIDVSSWTLVLHAQSAGFTENADLPPAPSTIHVTNLSAREGEVEIDFPSGKQITLHGVAFSSSDNGAGVWTTQFQASAVKAGELEAGTSSMQIRGDRDKISFSDLHLQCGEGVIAGDGQFALNDKHAARMKLTASRLPVTMLVGVQWQMKLSGFVSGDLTYLGNDDAATAQGQFTVEQGKFNILPWLGKVTALVNLPDISDLELDKATTDFTWKSGNLILTNLDVRKNDVTRLSGTVTIDPQSQVDGHIKLGLPSTVTARWPALQDKIFSDAHDDYAWTDVHLTGTPDHLQEDLTARLVTVGLQEGNGALNQTSKKAMDLLKSFLGN